jgi:hypothetical protein
MAARCWWAELAGSRDAGDWLSSVVISRIAFRELAVDRRTVVLLCIGIIPMQ